MIAFMEGCLNVAELLLEQGADMTVINKVRICRILALFMNKDNINAFA